MDGQMMKLTTWHKTWG